MAHTIGIDLGTTNSVVAFVDNGKVEVIPNAEGGRTTPSVVFYKSGDEIVVGELAKRAFVTSPGRCVRSIKRIVGKRAEELGLDAEDLPYQIGKLDDGMAGVLLDGEVLIRPEDVSADILDKMRRTAEDYLGTEVTQAVITVPAHFNDQQRVATKAAAEMAGLEVQRIINEPTAAALAYGVGQGRDGKVAVFDFGGGTFDVSILQIHRDIFEVLSTNGDNHLGGDDVDNRLYQEICDGILQQTGIDPSQDIRAVQRIRETAEKAKCELSSLASTQISLPFIVADSAGPKHFEMGLTREQFDEMMDPIFQRLFEPCKRALADAQLEVSDIDDVLLVGGSTRIPRVIDLAREFFGREPNRSVNPDEAIAVGAAIQSAVVSGALREILLLDVTPLTLGIELAGGVFKELIGRNSTIPCEASRKFTTVVDNQTSVVVHVLQGERRRASENHSLAKFRLVGLPPMPKELLEIEVKFSIDANGILSVSATDLATGQQTGIVIENYGEIGSRRAEIDRLIEAGVEHEDEDDKFVQFSERRQRAERIQTRADRTIAAVGDAMTEIDIKTLKESMLKLDLAMEAMNSDRMEDLETIIKDILERYEENIELHRLLNQELMPGLGESSVTMPKMSNAPIAGAPATAPPVSDVDFEPPVTEPVIDMPPPSKGGVTPTDAPVAEEEPPVEAEPPAPAGGFEKPAHTPGLPVGTFPYMVAPPSADDVDFSNLPPPPPPPK